MPEVNGTGIPPETWDKLFQPFFTTKPTGEGTGLGLSISWDIIAQQHGHRCRQPGRRVERVHDPAAARPPGDNSSRGGVTSVALATMSPSDLSLSSTERTRTASRA